MAGKIKALLNWCQKNTAGYRDVNVVNMTTSWKNGLAFCALIHHFRPDLIDFESLSKENVLHNNKLAFETAENELGIAALLDAEDMVAMKVPDKLSIITYVSQYYNCLHDMQPMAPSPNVKAPKRSASVLQPEQVEVKKKPSSSAVEKNRRPIVPDRPQTFSSCEICKKKVHLVERFIDEGKVYHRQCHRTKSLSGMYRRSAASSQHLTDANTFIGAPVVKLKNDCVKDANAKTDFSLPVSTPQETPSPASKSEPEKTSKISAMAQVFEKKSKESLGLTTNSNQFRKKDPASKVSGDNTEIKKPVLVENNTELKNLIPAENLSKIESANKPSHEANQKPKKVDEPTDIDNAADTSMQPQITETEQKCNNTTKKNVKNELPGLLRSLADAKQQKINMKSMESQVVDPTTPSDESKELFPSLLSSLADVQKGDMMTGMKVQAVGDSDDTTPTSPFAPLISELPKAPETKPRSQTASSEAASIAKPVPRKRSYESGNQHHNEPYDDDLNPFGAEDSINSSENPNRPPYNASLNPFGDEDKDLKERASSKSTNPFEDEDSTSLSNMSLDTKSSASVTSDKLRTGTVNMVNSRDSRLNPFTDEYEDRKESPNPPMPPVRRKTHEPTRPKGPSASVSSKSESGSLPPKVAPGSISAEGTPISVKAKSSPARRKGDAPVWKSDVKEKMEQMNQLNDKNTKFVDKTSCTSQTSKSSDSRSQIRRSVRKSTEGRTKQGEVKPIVKPNRPAPGFGFPLVKRKVKSQMTEDEISNEMTIIDLQLKDLEKKGVKLEEILREEMEIDLESKSESDQLLGDWFELVQEKNKLVRRETDLVFLMRQQRLEQEHADVEFKIRKLMNKPDSAKTDEDKEEESKLLEKLVEIVERRNTIINSIEESRLKEEEEDAAFLQIRPNTTELAVDPGSSKKKKKSKVKKIFTKKKKNSKPSKSESEEVASPS